MTRHIIGREGVEERGVIIAPGAIKMPKEPVPVTAAFGGRIIGKAYAFQRDEDTGELSVEIIMSGEFSIPDDDFDYSFSAKNVSGEADGDTSQISSADLMEVALIPPLKVVEAVVDEGEDTQAPPA